MKPEIHVYKKFSRDYDQIKQVKRNIKSDHPQIDKILKSIWKINGQLNSTQKNELINKSKMILDK